MARNENAARKARARAINAEGTLGLDFGTVDTDGFEYETNLVELAADDAPDTLF
jgi:hypothetical protein